MLEVSLPCQRLVTNPTLINTRIVYENQYMRVREDQISRDGSVGTYSYLDKPDFVVIVPYERGGFHLVEQYRHPVGHRSWEFPQGSLPNLKETDDFAHLAALELAQETGHRAHDLKHLGRLNAMPGSSSQGFHVFFATELEVGSPDRELEEQDMEHKWVSHDAFRRMIQEGSITDAATVATYLLVSIHGLLS
jgi:8-oxo-dGDP phosphatase